MEASAAARQLHVVPDDEDAERDELLLGARKIANAMGLRDYAVTILDELPEEGLLATVTVPRGRKHILLRLCEDFEALDEVEQRHAFVHEFVHVHLAAATDRVYEDVRPELGSAAFRLFWSGFVADMETAVDSLASVLAPSMPTLCDDGESRYAVGDGVRD